MIMQPRTPKRIGEILVDLGRITAEQLDQALREQQVRGGYLGDVLVAMGLVSHAEIRYGLADQYDLPFVRLQPDAIDREVAALVPGGWARDHLVLPVLRAGSTVTVVIADPDSLDQLEHVRRWTDAAEVEPALATADTIRALINAVHGAEGQARVSLPAVAAEALELGATEMGVSLTGERPRAWYRVGEAVFRRDLDRQWGADLQNLIAPLFPLQSPEAVRHWSAVLSLGSKMYRVECGAFGEAGVLELVARIGQRLPSSADPAALDPALRNAASEAVRSGPVVIAAAPERDAVLPEVFNAHLPMLTRALAGPNARLAYLGLAGADHLPDGALRMAQREAVLSTLEELAAFALDALTVDLGDLGAGELAAAAAAARWVVFRRGTELSNDVRLAALLTLQDGNLTWTLADPRHGAD